jgi:uncharacterized membrane protein YeaQ/YmgE (transglycosylase-associated protein family)
MGFIGWLLFGLIVGALAKLLMPGKDPGGCLVTSLLGIAGSFTGGFLWQLLFGGATDGSRIHPASFLGSIIGTMILLGIYRMMIGRNPPPPR